MKKLLKILSAAVISTAFIGSFASAATCDEIVVNNTGPGSNNQVVCNVTVDVTVTCTNGTYLLNSNSQSAVSGAVNNQGNTSGGAAISGNATNENGQTVAIGSQCGPATTTTTNEEPGRGAAGGGAGAAMPDVLPNTASVSTETIVIGSLLVAAAVIALSRVIVVAHRHFTLR